MTVAQYQWIQALLVLSRAAVHSAPAVQALYNERLEEALAEIEPLQAVESDDCGGCNRCPDCIKWSEFELCPVCRELTFVPGKGCEECGYGGECPDCGCDLAHGTHGKRVAVDGFVCLDARGRRLN